MNQDSELKNGIAVFPLVTSLVSQGLTPKATKANEKKFTKKGNTLYSLYTTLP